MLPTQERELASLQGAGTHPAIPAADRRLAVVTGLFNLLWATVTVLMVIRPGSTTGSVTVDVRPLRITANVELPSLLIKPAKNTAGP
ncbi:hypothetical protein [Streptomyces roseoverticillatus]|uniref:hypothetical protein n=1 Tax=Streptomyces roseoverticillatus TaxID=66429 RepID=UPI0027E52F09|nr:hypothetical protein [Streptomyces roseoverticillatus]